MTLSITKTRFLGFVSLKLYELSRQEKETQLILDRLQAFQDVVLDRCDRLDQFNTEHVNSFDKVFAKIESKSAHKEPRKPTIQELLRKGTLEVMQEPKAKDENITTIQDQVPETTETPTEQVVPTGEDGELSIPVEHTTAAHKLLLWPSIRKLLYPREYDEDYVMKLEEQRGLIRVYGRGEGDETSEDNSLPAPPANLSTSFDENQKNYAASPSGPWGVGVNAPQVKLADKGFDETGPTKDLYNFAYWTCLQLESDILAELDLPASGISRSEGRISLPKGRFTLSLPNEISAPSTMMMFFYSAQIHLRKVLNRVHTDLYKVEKQGQTHWSSHVQEILSMNLELWRNSLPTVMKWKDTDPPSEEINVARMRAKYYGARYIIHRPLLYHALHHYGQLGFRASSDDPPTEATAMTSSKSQRVSSSLSHSQSATNMARLSSDMGPASGLTGVAHRDLPIKLRRACKVCIDSAMLSTVAFDGVKGRPVVTNIFGTAHAQFGNMLVLSATYMSSLSELVDRNELERLLKRTINFLLQSRHISPTLRADARILTEIHTRIFGGQSTGRENTNNQ
ncbi:hypothetical protein BBP40_003107 [Aspergillus hancockii]|nr:hypothetical protein BBP40_003107 [Aspergillus hancockii]